MEEAFQTFPVSQTYQPRLIRPLSAFYTNSRPRSGAKTSRNWISATRPSTAQVKNVHQSKRQSLDMKDFESYSWNLTSDSTRQAKTARNATSRNSLAFIIGESQSLKSRPQSAAYPLPHTVKTTKLSYAINAFPLFNTLRKIEATDFIDQFALEAKKAKLIDNKLLTKIKQKVSPEAILSINADDPESASSRCLELMSQEKHKKFKTRAEIPVYKPTPAPKPAPKPEPKPEPVKIKKSNKYKEEMVSIWNHTVSVENNKPVDIEYKEEREDDAEEVYFKKCSSIPNLIGHQRSQSSKNSNDKNDNRGIPAVSIENKKITKEIDIQSFEDNNTQRDFLLSTRSLKSHYSTHNLKINQDPLDLIAVGSGVKLHSVTRSKLK